MIKDNIESILSEIPNNVQLVAVSKTKPTSVILEAYEAGQRHFGENKVQEVVDKQKVLPANIQWHLIGHLQTNKVKQIAPFIALIHSVDSSKLLAEINKQGIKNNRVIPCLLQFHIAEEESKFGLSFDEAVALLSSQEYKAMRNIAIIGVMGMATFTENESQIHKEFKTLKNIFTQLKSKFFADISEFKEISMGMSGDYKIAIEEGSSMIRVGGNIFGHR